MEVTENRLIREAEEKANEIIKKAEQRCRRILYQAEDDADREVADYERKLRSHYSSKSYDLTQEMAQLEVSKKNEYEAAGASYTKNEKRTVDYLIEKITNVHIAFPQNVISQFKHTH